VTALNIEDIILALAENVIRAEIDPMVINIIKKDIRKAFSVLVALQAVNFEAPLHDHPASS
jgi:hypothetical protein